MTIADLLDSCLTAEAAAREFGCEATFPIVLPRRAGNGRRMRVLPGVMGELLTENCDGRAVVRVHAADVRRYLKKAGFTR